MMVSKVLYEQLADRENWSNSTLETWKFRLRGMGLELHAIKGERENWSVYLVRNGKHLKRYVGAHKQSRAKVARNLLHEYSPD